MRKFLAGIGHGFGGPNGRLRRQAYGSLALMVVVYVLVYFYTNREAGVLVRSYCYALIGMLYLAGSRQVRTDTQYHPAYKIEKVLGGVGFLGIGASLAVGIVGSNVFLWFWIGAMVVAQVGSFEFVLFRNESLRHRFLTTIAGPMAYPVSREEADAILDRGLAMLRHHLVSPEMVEATKDALNMPTSSDMARHLRDQIRERRRAAMAEAAMAVDAEAESW